MSYGIDPSHPCADLLELLHHERYGPLHRLERERFTTVPRRRRPPDEATLAARRFHRLAVVLARIDDGRQEAA